MKGLAFETTAAPDADTMSAEAASMNLRSAGLEPYRDRQGVVLRTVSKAFPGVQALANVSFSIGPGSVHALVGENGAGKSTLLKIMSGICQPDRGSIYIDGHEVQLDGPVAARAYGIAVIHQELNLVPGLSVAHNLFLGREYVIGRGILSHRKLCALAREALDRVNLNINPLTQVGQLGVAEQQLVEIAAALSQNARFLLMDEPTASLTDRERGLLFERITGLKAAGVGILYISHRLEEISQLADRVTVMRDGKVVSSCQTHQTTLSQIIAEMVGRPLDKRYPPRVPRLGETILEVSPAPHRPRGRAIEVRRGEVLGLAGLVGAGRTEWAWRLFGASASIGESVKLLGSRVQIRTPAEARALGLGMVPENRKDHGLIPAHPVRNNIALTVLERMKGAIGLLSSVRMRLLSGDLIGRLQIKCAHDQVRVETLSGGNQQKIVLAKWLARGCELILLDEPTRGIDVGAKFEMYRLINELSEAGKAIILISSDLLELLAMSDRVAVMHEGDIVAVLDKEQATQERVLHFASGYFESDHAVAAEETSASSGNTMKKGHAPSGGAAHRRS